MSKRASDKELENQFASIVISVITFGAGIFTGIALSVFLAGSL